MVWESSLVGEEKVYGENDLPKTQVLCTKWKTERVRENESGNSEGIIYNALFHKYKFHLILRVFQVFGHPVVHSTERRICDSRDQGVSSQPGTAVQGPDFQKILGQTQEKLRIRSDLGKS